MKPENHIEDLPVWGPVWLNTSVKVLRGVAYSADT